MSQPGFLRQPYRNKISFICLQTPAGRQDLCLARLLVKPQHLALFRQGYLLTDGSFPSVLAAQTSPSPLKQ